MKNAPRPAIFKWRQTAPELILCAVRWYLRYSLSLRDVEELFAERGLEADHTTIWCWVQRYSPKLEQRLRRHLKPTNKSWRVCGELLISPESAIRHTQAPNFLENQNRITANGLIVRPLTKV